MDKLRILKEFGRLTLKKALEADEIRLYLLLLANCDKAGNGKIDCRVIKNALGNKFLSNRLNRTCRQLSVHGLIEVITPSFEEISEEDFSVEYRILQLAINNGINGEEMEDSGILIVDDDRDDLKLASFLFESEGIKVHCAASGKEALRKLEERTFTMMITDLNMSGMDGFELARKAREIAPGMTIVMSTGDRSPEIRRLAKESGIVEVFAKPFQLKEILSMVGGEHRKFITPIAWQGRDKSEYGGMRSWICPSCRTRYQGWSTLKKCYECGYLEDGS